MNKWMPIETAPKDGTIILGGIDCVPKRYSFSVIYWSNAKNGWFTGGFDPARIYPTHWMPLPNPPEKTPDQR